MKLPPNFFYIPGFGNRYAVKANETYTGCDPVVYSLVAPGTHTPSIMRSVRLERGAAVTIAARAGSYKQSHTIKSLIEKTMATSEFKLAAIEYRRDVPASTAVTAVPHMQPAQRPVWVIATVTKGNGIVTFKFAQDPKQHTEIEAAYAEADRLATQNPGVEYAVFRNVRRVKSGGISRVDF